MSETRAPEQVSLLPPWLFYATLGIILLSPSQLAYVVHKREGPFIGYVDVLAGLVCLLALGIAAWGRRWRLLAYPPLPASALVVVAALSLSQAAQLRTGVVEVGQLALYLLAVYTLFLNTLTDARRVRLAILALFLGTTVVVGWGLAQYLAPSGDSDPLLVRAGFTNRNTYSAYLALMLPLALAAALHTRRLPWRIWCGVLVAAGLLTMLSGPLIWLTVLTLALVALGARGLRRWGALAGLALFVALLFYALPRNYAAAVTELRHPYETEIIHVPVGGAELTVPVLHKRWLEWQPALVMWSRSPILGVGAGNYQGNIGQHYSLGLPNVKKSEPDTNNLYLVTAGSMGFLGLVALLALFGHFWGRARELWSVAEGSLGRALAAGLPVAMLALVLGNLFTAMFVRGLSLIVVLMFVLAAVGERGRSLPRAQRTPPEG